MDLFNQSQQGRRYFKI